MRVFAYALTGATLSALLGFGIARLIGHRALAQLTGSRVHSLSICLRAGGSTAVAALRLIPVAHFTVISLAAGASHIRTRDYVIGTLLGMAPGIAVIALVYPATDIDPFSEARWGQYLWRGTLVVDRVSAVTARPGPG